VESRLFSQLRELGYRLFHMETNYFSPANVAEAAWIHESLLTEKDGAGQSLMNHQTNHQ